MLGSIVENIQKEFEKPSRSDNQTLDKLCVKRRTIRAKCSKKNLDNYEFLLEVWEEYLKQDLDFVTNLRFDRCKKQMNLFKFSLALNLSQRLNTITDNLSKSLQ